MTQADLNWGQALECHRKRDENGFITAVLPFVENLAQKRAARYVGSKLGASFGEDDLLSYGLDGARQVYEMPLSGSATDPDGLMNLCHTVIVRRMIEKERTASQHRWTTKVNEHGLDDLPLKKRDALMGSRSATETFDERSEHTGQNESPVSKWRDDRITVFLKTILPPQQAKAMCALIQYVPQGYEQKEIAEMLGMKPNTFASHVSLARKLLVTEYPTTGRSILEDILETDGTEKRKVLPVKSF